MGDKKAQGEDGITDEIFKQTFKILPKSITAMYNGCLKNGIFPEIWKKVKSYRLQNQTHKTARTLSNTAR
jgi:hypothetical protein